MPPESAQLQELALDQLAPFHIILDAAGVVQNVGPALARILPGLTVGTVRADAIQIQRPKLLMAADADLRKGLGRVIVLDAHARKKRMRMRGSFYELHEEDYLTFLGSPWINELTDMEGLGLRLADFAPHDPVTEYLMLMQTKEIALEESENFMQDLRESRRQAEQANKAKSTFLAVMSHEIRNPMNGLGSMADLLATTVLDGEQAEFVRIIQECSATLKVLVDDVLDFSKIEAGQLELERIPFRVQDVLGATAHLYGELAASKDVELARNCAAQVPDWLVGDPTRLRQVLSNLVGNAIKFTDQGSVTINVDWAPADGDLARTRDQERADLAQTGGCAALSVPDGTLAPELSSTARKGRLRKLRDQSATRNRLALSRPDPGDESGLGTLRLVVSDTGCGIPSEAQGGLFQPFTQADSSTTRRFGGTGLGLAISRDLARAMGGDVVLGSSDESGTTFVVEVVLSVGEAVAGRSARGLGDAGDAESLARYAERRVLMVDDNPVNRKIAASLLARFGIEPVLATNGREAVEAAESEAFDLVLMDMQMPVMGGADATRAIRAGDGPSAASTVIAFTANVLAEQRAEITDAGMDGMLEKPVRLKDLAGLLERCFAG